MAIDKQPHAINYGEEIGWWDRHKINGIKKRILGTATNYDTYLGMTEKLAINNPLAIELFRLHFAAYTLAKGNNINSWLRSPGATFYPSRILAYKSRQSMRMEIARKQLLDRASILTNNLQDTSKGPDYPYAILRAANILSGVLNQKIKENLPHPEDEQEGHQPLSTTDLVGIIKSAINSQLDSIRTREPQFFSDEPIRLFHSSP